MHTPQSSRLRLPTFEGSPEEDELRARRKQFSASSLAQRARHAQELVIGLGESLGAVADRNEEEQRQENDTTDESAGSPPRTGPRRLSQVRGGWGVGRWEGRGRGGKRGAEVRRERGNATRRHANAHRGATSVHARSGSRRKPGRRLGSPQAKACTWPRW